MAETSTETPQDSRFGAALSMAAGLFALPGVLLARPARVLGLRKFVADAFVEGNLRYLTDAEHRNRIEYVQTPVDRSAEIRAKTEAHIRALVAMEDWIGLADTMAELDQTRAACPDGARLIYPALDTVTRCFAKGYYEPNACMPFPAAAIDPLDIDRVEAIAAANPDHYVLSAIAAHFRLQNAWEYRGGIYADAVAEDEWEAAQNCAARAYDTLDPCIETHPTSPLVAYMEFSHLPFDPEGDRHIHALYREWAELDPDNHLAHRQYGCYLLPRWFGGDEDFDLYLRKAALENQGTCGAGAYASAYLFMTTIDQFAVYHMDESLFCEGVFALAERSDNDPCVVARLVQQVHLQAQFSVPRKTDAATAQALETKKARLIGLRDQLLRAHLTAINPSAWDGGTQEALNCLSLALQDELATDATFVLDRNGLTVCEESVKRPDAHYL